MERYKKDELIIEITHLLQKLLPCGMTEEEVAIVLVDDVLAILEKQRQIDHEMAFAFNASKYYQ